ncbi:hypothetical protein CBOM_00604 [Ceraceosorus bombacis]|uniref:Uncharacterized protein n=1 Tax=Ceraceosorus bombacis TaxID=401625 RepID=A0A0P1BAJ9_9BASI|nr:hypothetical protein CBOM_00604 [Ceraceosorus bombacis]
MRSGQHCRGLFQEVIVQITTVFIIVVLLVVGVAPGVAASRRLHGHLLQQLDVVVKMKTATKPTQIRIYLWHINYATDAVDSRPKPPAKLEENLSPTSHANYICISWVIKMKTSTQPAALQRKAIRLYLWHVTYATDAVDQREKASA